MIEIVVNYDQTKQEYQIYESSTQTLILSTSLGDGFKNLNGYLLSSGQITKSILEDQNIQYHFDAFTFQEIIKSNISLLKRVSEIPSEFKNSANKFGMPSVPKDIVSKNKKQNFSRGSKNFQHNKMSGFGGSNFSKSFGRFGKTKF